jgi:hypothetical protein
VKACKVFLLSVCILGVSSVQADSFLSSYLLQVKTWLMQHQPKAHKAKSLKLARAKTPADDVHFEFLTS